MRMFGIDCIFVAYPSPISRSGFMHVLNNAFHKELSNTCLQNGLLETWEWKNAVCLQNTAARNEAAVLDCFDKFCWCLTWCMMQRLREKFNQFCQQTRATGQDRVVAFGKLCHGLVNAKHPQASKISNSLAALELQWVQIKELMEARAKVGRAVSLLHFSVDWPASALQLLSHSNPIGLNYLLSSVSISMFSAGKAKLCLWWPLEMVALKQNSSSCMESSWITHRDSVKTKICCTDELLSCFV